MNENKVINIRYSIATLIVVLSAVLSATFINLMPASAAHSHVDTPSGCHETNGNARKGSSMAWTNSNAGHDRASEVSSVHHLEGCEQHI